jgi:hypothetical protein
VVILSEKPILTVDSTYKSRLFPPESLFILWKASVGSPQTKFFQWIPHLRAGGTTIYAVEGSQRKKNPLDGSESKIPNFEGSLPEKKIFLKFKLENVINIKNLIRPYYELHSCPKKEKKLY